MHRGSTHKAGWGVRKNNRGIVNEQISFSVEGGIEGGGWGGGSSFLKKHKQEKNQGITSIADSRTISTR